MPIRPELRHLYNTAAWQATRKRILIRAGGRFEVPPGKRVERYMGGARCEQCRVLDRKTVSRAAGWWLDTERPCLNCLTSDFKRRILHPPCTCTGIWIPAGGATIEHPAAQSFPQAIRRIVVITLTIAHVNHLSGDDRDENLAAWCQWCHLNHDQAQHKETRSDRKDAGRPIIQEAEHDGR